MKCSLLPNLDILGAPVGDYLHCSRFIANKCAESKKLLSSLADVAGVDLQVAFTLLRMCGGFCKMVHLTRVSVASDALVSDEDVRQCFVLCSAIEVSDRAWKQAQLGLMFGGLGLLFFLAMQLLPSLPHFRHQAWAFPTIAIFNRQS